MTNPALVDHGASISPELLALAPVGRKRRPARVVQHPAFRSPPRVALEAPLKVIRIPVVALNGPAADSSRRRPEEGQNPTPVLQEAA